MAKKQGITWTNERRKLSDLIPWERNPRTINNAQAERLVDSVETFGQVETLAIDCRNNILNGHQRASVLAGQHGMDYEVDVRVANRVLTERERQQLTVYLHRGTTGAWDFEELANSFEFDDLVTWGFSEEELLGLDFGEEPTSAGADTPPEIDKAEELRVKWNVSSGQLWALGDHRLICGDCTDAAVVARVMGGEKAGATVTDPPYGVGVEYDDFDDTIENVKALIDGFMPIALTMQPIALTPGIPAMWHYPKPDWLMAWIHPAATSSGPWGFIGMNPILIYGDDPYLKNGLGRQHGHVVMVADRNGLDAHPVTKPINVWEWLIERMTIDKGIIVYDSFVGSGTTLIACHNLGRKCRAVEISPAYVAVALQRFADHTGIEPVLIDDLYEY